MAGNDNVVRLDCPENEIIDLLEATLKTAREGGIENIYVACTAKDGDVINGFVLGKSVDAVFGLIGLIAVGQQSLTDKFDMTVESDYMESA